MVAVAGASVAVEETTNQKQKTAEKQFFVFTDKLPPHHFSVTVPRLGNRLGMIELI